VDFTDQAASKPQAMSSFSNSLDTADDPGSNKRILARILPTEAAAQPSDSFPRMRKGIPSAAFGGARQKRKHTARLRRLLVVFLGATAA
jgi:hypothetical protein